MPVSMIPPEMAPGFLARAGWAGAQILPLAGDASFRRYFRVILGDRHAVLMDAPPPQEDPQDDPHEEPQLEDELSPLPFLKYFLIKGNCPSGSADSPKTAASIARSPFSPPLRSVRACEWSRAKIRFMSARKSSPTLVLRGLYKSTPVRKAPESAIKNMTFDFPRE